MPLDARQWRRKSALVVVPGMVIRDPQEDREIMVTEVRQSPGRRTVTFLGSRHDLLIVGYDCDLETTTP